jgi:hypothetical protein
MLLMPFFVCLAIIWRFIWELICRIFWTSWLHCFFWYDLPLEKYFSNGLYVQWMERTPLWISPLRGVNSSDSLNRNLLLFKINLYSPKLAVDDETSLFSIIFKWFLDFFKNRYVHRSWRWLAIAKLRAAHSNVPAKPTNCATVDSSSNTGANISTHCFFVFLAIYLGLAPGSWDLCRLRRTSRVLSWLRTDEAGPRPPTDLCEIKTGISLYFLNIF